MSHLNSTRFLVAGTAAGALISVAALPLLARVYAPATFGVFAALFTVTVALGAVVTGGQEVELQRVKTDRVSIILWSVVSRTVLSLGVLTTVAFLLELLVGDGRHLPLLGAALACVFVGALQRIWISLALREAKYFRIGLSRIAYGVISTTLQVVLGLRWPTAEALLFGVALGTFGAVAVLVIGSSKPAHDPTMRRYERSRSWGLAVNGFIAPLTLGAPVVLLGVFGFSQLAGLVAMASRVPSLFLSTVVQPLGQDLQATLGRSIRLAEGGDAPLQQWKRTIRHTVAIAVIGGTASLGLALVDDLVLGDSWSGLSDAILVLLPLGVFQLACFVGSSALAITGKSRALGTWEVWRTLVMVVMLLVPLVAGFEWPALLLYSVSGSVMYLVLYVLANNAVRSLSPTRPIVGSPS